jgi:hypothetical protein
MTALIADVMTLVEDIDVDMVVRLLLTLMSLAKSARYMATPQTPAGGATVMTPIVMVMKMRRLHLSSRHQLVLGLGCYSPHHRRVEQALHPRQVQGL